MSHDKIKAAVRARMARTGEPYSVARRAVLAERGRTFFPLRYDAGGPFWTTEYTSGSHVTPGGQVLLDGSGHGLVEFDVDPPVTGGRGIRARMPRPPVRKVVLGLDDPDSFIAAVASTDDRP